MKIKIENVSYEAYIVKYFQSEDNSWNFAVFTDLRKAFDFAETVSARGFSFSIEGGYLEYFDYDEDDFI